MPDRFSVESKLDAISADVKHLQTMHEAIRLKQEIFQDRGVSAANKTHPFQQKHVQQTSKSIDRFRASAQKVGKHIAAAKKINENMKAVRFDHPEKLEQHKQLSEAGINSTFHDRLLAAGLDFESLCNVTDNRHLDSLLEKAKISNFKERITIINTVRGHVDCTASTAAHRLRELRALLKEGLIDQNLYDTQRKIIIKSV